MVFWNPFDVEIVKSLVPHRPEPATWEIVSTVCRFLSGAAQRRKDEIESRRHSRHGRCAPTLIDAGHKRKFAGRLAEFQGFFANLNGSSASVVT